jgi:DNA-binding MarR family transcriptional regulator
MSISNYMLIDMYMSDDNKPIGWWLKEVDRRLEASFERLLADDGLTRRQWQALNAAAHQTPGRAPQRPTEAAHPPAEAAQKPDEAAQGSMIAAALAPFLSGDPAELAAVVDPLVERGWLAGDRLTADGERALQALTTKVHAHRRSVTRGITADEYQATVDVLRRMAANLA